MATASLTFVCFSSGLVTPRSAKTLPELGTTSDLVFLFGISHLIVRLGFVEPPSNQLDIFPCGLYPARRLFLERMKHVDCALKFDRVHRPIGVCAMVLDYFEDAWSFPSPRLRAWMLSTKLSDTESGSNFINNRLGKSQQVIFA